MIPPVAARAICDLFGGVAAFVRDELRAVRVRGGHSAAVEAPLHGIETALDDFNAHTRRVKKAYRR